ncbi:MAG: RNA polymerase-associated protein RapA [Bacteriovoracaceae bacterium]|nr:RNA polymerase-associated protein RapA [Bacteriovoracaceae bacterium]
MRNFLIGQRWISESEPELGLGMVMESEAKTVMVYFPAAKVERRYGTQTAPLRRIQFMAGDEIRLQDGSTHLVTDAQEKNGLVTYLTAAGAVAETNLSDTLSLSRPEERLFAGQVDSNDLFKIRYDLLLNQRNLFLSPVRGFTGPRLALIPHQQYVAHEVATRPRPRVMLADEVGLGKTIEAGMILHHLIMTGRAERALIIVPDSLVYQWFVEMLKKFNLSFATINHESELEEGDNPFEDQQLFIVSLRYLMQNPWLSDCILNDEWDMLIVDEAHQLRWNPGNPSAEYQLIEKIAEHTEGLILLSGTPEILGLGGHFARLHLLDPQRFHDYDKFLEEHAGYEEISAIAKFLSAEKALTATQEKKLKALDLNVPKTKEEREKTLADLLDRHGTGRVYFRNTRKRMASFAEFFPKRVLHPHPINPGKGKNAEKQEYTQKVEWLVEHLNATKEAKTLLLCHDKEMVVQLEASLKQLTSAKAGVFHNGMPLLHRDRAAAWFMDPEGAQILLSTENGAEGRNFEFAQHLILFDLPKLPDLLEQRIGRLDRIGQKNDINIHVPYLLGGSEEILFRWYHEGLDAFESSPRGASELYATVRPDLIALIEAGSLEEKALAALIKKTKKEHEQIEERLEEGQDRLVELNSYDEIKAQGHITALKETEGSPVLRDFMLSLCERLGVDVEDLDGTSYFLKPSDNMYLPHFPGLPHEGISVTFSREIALKRPELHFLTWDHSMVLGIMDLISSKELGNVTVSSWKAKAPEPFLIEAFFTLQCLADRKLQPQKWFPPTPLRVLLNAKGVDMTQKIPKKMVDDGVVSGAPDKIAQVRTLPREVVKELLKKGKESAVPRAKQYKEKFLLEMKTKFDSEIARLEKLRAVNPTVSLQEIVTMKTQKLKLEKAMNEAQLNLDSLRIIL